MVKRVLPMVVAACLLVLLIAYSQYRPLPDRVSGFVEADEIRVGSRIGGRVLEVLAEEGRLVAKGALLVRLEAFDLLELQHEAEAALALRTAAYDRMLSGFRPEEIGQARAKYEQLRAKLDQLVAGPRPQEIEAAKARLQVAQAQFQLAQKIYSRAESLAGTAAISGEAIDRAVEDLSAASGGVAARSEELAILEAGAREEEIRAAQATVDEAKFAWELVEKGYRAEEIQQAASARDAAAASLRALQQRIDELTIRSPVDGRVESLELRPGDLVAAGAPVLALVDLGRLWVRGYLPEDRLDVKIGHPVEVAVDSYPGRRFAANVTFVARQAEFTPSNVQTPAERVKQVFRFKATLTEGIELLRPGMSADVWLSSTERPL